MEKARKIFKSLLRTVGASGKDQESRPEQAENRDRSDRTAEFSQHEEEQQDRGEGAFVLIVDADQAQEELLYRVLSHEGYRVGAARTGEDGYALAVQQRPGVILVNARLPGIDGYQFCRLVRQNPATHSLPVLMLGPDDVASKLAGFDAGADEYLAKPFALKELLYYVQALLARAPRPAQPADTPSTRGQSIAVFGSKGGVGKTTIAVNLAISLKQLTGQRVALVDADFFFGDVGIHLNLGSTHSFVDLIDHLDELDQVVVDQVFAPHPSGIHVLLSPSLPETANLIKPDHVVKLLQFLVTAYDFVVLDCPTSYDDRVLAILEQVDDILLVITPEVGSVTNTAAFLDLALRLGLPAEKLHIVLNRENSRVGIEESEIEDALQHPIEFRLPSGGRAVALSVNRGAPLVLNQPNHPFAKKITHLAACLIGSRTEPTEEHRPRSTVSANE